MGKYPKVEKLVMYNFLKETYNGKKVFVTGHTGFKGSWLLVMLKELGAEVMGFSLAPETDNDLFHHVNGHELCTSIIGDICYSERVKHAIINFQPDFIFHMAAQALVLPSYEDPLLTYRTNVMGTAHVLDALKFIEKAVSVVNITTDKVYQNKERMEPYAEEEALGGYDPYSASKAGAEIVSQSYRLSFFNPEKHDQHQKAIANARSGNVIGGGDWNEARLIPDLARALRAKEELVIRNPKAVRPWQHVLDPLCGYLLLGGKLVVDPIKFAGNYNFGPDPESELTVKKLIEISIQTWGEGTFRIEQTQNQPHEAGLLKLNISKAKAELNWKPILDSAKTVEWTIDWYKTAKENWEYKTREQVNAFFKLIT